MLVPEWTPRDCARSSRGSTRLSRRRPSWIFTGGAAVLSLGSSQRTTIDIDVLPSSRFDEKTLRQAWARIGLPYEPSDKGFAETEYLEVIPEATLVLPHPSEDHPYNTVFRGRRFDRPDAAPRRSRRREAEAPGSRGHVGRFVPDPRLRLGAADLRESFDRLPRRTAVLVELLQLALSGLERVQEAPGVPGGDLARLANRQARALVRGRRTYLRNLLRRVGGGEEESSGEVPRRMPKAYPLVGWDPPGFEGGRPRS